MGKAFKTLLHSKIFMKYKLFMTNTHELILLFDMRGRIIDANKKAAEELGYGQEIYNIGVYDIFKEVFQYKNNELKVIEGYQDKMGETIAYRRNQTCFPVELKVSGENNAKYFIGICVADDITKKKDDLNQIRELKQENKDFNIQYNEVIANLTHELRTPVNGIIGFGSNLLSTQLTADQDQAVKIILQCCANMNNTINQLLDYAKLSNSKLVLEEREFGFRQFITRIIDLNRIQINRKGLNLLLNIAEDIPDRLVGDELRLEQVLNNLFSNAIKFTSQGQIGLDVVKTWENEHNLELFFVIMDSGIGISREEMDKLFKSFSQVDSSITRNYGGTGLGLSISKMIVEAMHGTIEVDSEKNVGSTFSFSVRLGLPNDDSRDFTPGDSYDNEEAYSFENCYDDRQEAILTEGEESDRSDIDDISRMLQKVHKENYQHIIGSDSVNRDMHNLMVCVERLSICLEMENWEKAEEIACSIRKSIPQDHKQAGRRVLRLLLAIRKGNKNDSMALLNEIKSGLPKDIM